jgi:hypothetical protein
VGNRGNADWPEGVFGRMFPFLGRRPLALHFLWPSPPGPGYPEENLSKARICPIFF